MDAPKLLVIAAPFLDTLQKTPNHIITTVALNSQTVHSSTSLKPDIAVIR
jgi:hypothetical protein